MAIGGLKWLDSDMHLGEPWDFWSDYVDPKYSDWIPRWTGDPRYGKSHERRAGELGHRRASGVSERGGGSCESGSAALLRAFSQD